MKFKLLLLIAFCNLLSGVLTGGAVQALSKGGKIVSVAGKGILVLDAAGNAVMTGEGMHSIVKNGVSVGNAFQTIAGAAGLSGNAAGAFSEAFRSGNPARVVDNKVGGVNVVRPNYPHTSTRMGGILKGDNLAMPGAKSDTMVIGRLNDTSSYLGRDGYNVLNTNTWSIDVNDGWMGRGIMEGRTFELASEPGFNTLRRTEYLETGDYLHDTTIFHRELQLLRDAGYERIGDAMVPGANWTGDVSDIFQSF